MTIQFNPRELETIKRYLNSVESGEIQEPGPGPDQERPEWLTVFLLLRKLLAHGVHYTPQTDLATSYRDLQKRSQKADDMRVTIRACVDRFIHLLAVCTRDHRNENGTN